MSSMAFHTEKKRLSFPQGPILMPCLLLAPLHTPCMFVLPVLCFSCRFCSYFCFVVFSQKTNIIYSWKTWKILGSESVILPRSLDQTGQQQVGKQTRANQDDLTWGHHSEQGQAYSGREVKVWVSLALDYIAPHWSLRAALAYCWGLSLYHH